MDKRASVFLLLLSLIPAGLAPGHIGPPSRPAPPPDYAVAKGEELLYEVSWWIVKLGTIRMRVTDAVRDSAGARQTVRADIDTYENLPFASLHSVSESVLDSEYSSLASLSVTQEGEAWRTLRYDYAAERQALFIERGTTSGRDDRRFSIGKVDTLPIGPKFQDGLSIFYFARAHLPGGQKMSVPTVIDGHEGRTVFDFHGENTDEEIGVVDYPVDVVRFDGTMEFSGIYGLSGDFEGWFSNDDARVPIKASMQVMLGSIDVELIGWHRDGWSPPRHPED
jgi:hypothetical protein